MNFSQVTSEAEASPNGGSPRTFGEGDTYLVESLLPPDFAAVAFEALRDEVEWNTMIIRILEVESFEANTI